jgi:thiamine pyrophosphate-dependent acetolactate synthase large subunit-like protein
VPVLADAKIGAAALTAAFASREPMSGWGESDAEARLSAWRPEDEIDLRTDPRGLDPRAVMLELDRVLPKRRLLVASGGHCQAWPCMYMSVPDPRSFVHPLEFGSVGCGLGAALGAAVARPDRLTVCVTGDGDLLMSLADIDTAVRFGVRLVIVVLNDSAFGGEVHALSDLGLDPTIATFRNPSFASIADAVGGRGVTIETLDDIAALASSLDELDGLLVADCRIDPNVRAEYDRRNQARVLRRAPA